MNIYPLNNCSHLTHSVDAKGYHRIGIEEAYVHSDSNIRDIVETIIKATGVDLVVTGKSFVMVNAKAKRLPSVGPQAVKVQKHMERAGSISARDAMDDYGMTSSTLGRRICDLEANGTKIVRDKKYHPITQRPYTRYSLAA